MQNYLPENLISKSHVIGPLHNPFYETFIKILFEQSKFKTINCKKAYT